jgi:anhydro-N-acetylmuramic acid kinase
MKFNELSNKNAFLAAGLMSGTSMDGVDVALVRMGSRAEDPGVNLVAFDTHPYPDELKTPLMEMAWGERLTAEDIATLHTGVATSFAHGFFSLCRTAGVKSDDVDFIGSHGQTVAHVPPSPMRHVAISGTLQLGPPGMIAALTGVTTVGDFRVGDMALGGQGAPLVPYVDFLLRRSKESDRIILNIGGIANVTYLPKGCSHSEVIAFDTGPGNMILDELYRVLYPSDGGDFDTHGEKAKGGTASHELVETFLEFAFFGMAPPKSAGHHEFGCQFAWEFLSKARAAGLSREDTLASAMALTTRSIHDAVEKFVKPSGGIDEVYVSGGGSRNATMMEELKAVLSPAAVLPVDELGIPAEAKEAVDFAVLARETVLGRANVIHKATGASRANVLGTIALGSAQ